MLKRTGGEWVGKNIFFLHASCLVLNLCCSMNILNTVLERGAERLGLGAVIVHGVLLRASRYRLTASFLPDRFDDAEARLRVVSGIF